MAGSMYRAHGPSTEPGNSSTSVLVHSGGFSQRFRSSSSSLAAAAMALFALAGMILRMNETVKDYSQWGVPHPIPYQGSKRNLAAAYPLLLSSPMFPVLLSRLRVRPPSRWRRRTAAGGSVSDQRRTRPSSTCGGRSSTARRIWRTKYRKLWQAQLGREREYYDSVRKKFNETHKPEYFLYLLARCVKAAIRYNGDGEFNNSPDNRRKGAHPDTMRERIVGASALLQGRTEVSACDYREVLANCNSADLIYMDPPYQGVCRNRDNRYCPKIDHGEFCDSLAALNDKGCMYRCEL